MRVISFAHLSVLALAINLAACGDSEPTTSATAVTPAPAAATLTTTKTADTQAITREQVISHYADIAHATFADAHSTAQALQVALDIGQRPAEPGADLQRFDMLVRQDVPGPVGQQQAANARMPPASMAAVTNRVPSSIPRRMPVRWAMRCCQPVAGVSSAARPPDT